VRPNWTLLLLALAAAGCARDYVYAPETATRAKLAGRPAADVPIPPGAPQGDMRVATFGVSHIRSEGSDAPIAALHLREIVANDSPYAWTVDTRQQRVTLGDRGESRAAYASADAGTQPPLVTVPSGEKRTVDLFFPLPSDMAQATKLPQFDAIWTVHTGATNVTERTPFERLKVQHVDSSAYDWGFWGPAFWYDPVYPDGAWSGVPVFSDRPVVVDRPAPPMPVH
jgi:hypothetical protein